MLNSLTQIINVLKPGEVRLIRNYYKIQSNGEVKQRLNLFDLIRTQKVATDKEAAQTIYGGPPNSAYSHLKARLQKDILSLLLLQEGSKRYESPLGQAVFESRRMLIEGQMLIERGAYNMGVEILTKAAKLTEKFELFNEHIAINDILRSHLGVKKGLKAYEKYDSEINDNVDKMAKLLNAKDRYHRVLVPNLFSKNQEQHFSQYSEDAVNELRQYYKETNSGVIGYYYLYLSIYHYQIKKDMPKALESAQEFLTLIENTPAIYAASRVASANFQIAVIMAYLNKYDECMKYAEMASNKFAKGLLNELAAIELQFYAAFHNNDLDKAGKVIARARAHPKLNANKLNPSKWDYYEANLLFMQGDYEAAGRKLTAYSELMKDKAGWLLGHRILEMMCMHKSGDLDVMDFRTGSFRKLLQRQKGQNLARSKAIVKILEMYTRTGGNLRTTRNMEKDNLGKLRNGEGDFAWDPLGFELIRFDAWFDKLRT